MTELTPVPAATVVLVRPSQEKLVAEDVQNAPATGKQEHGIEVLLLLRNSKLAFHGGHWVFPGGRIDPADYVEAGSDLEYPAARCAVVRETKEEAGLEIASADLVHTAHWTTPPKLPRRFCTWFFVCAVDPSVAVEVDNQEILDHRWLSPERALADHEAEEIVLPRPTLTTLKDIQNYATVSELLEGIPQDGIRVFPHGSNYYKPEEMGYPFAED